MEYLMTYGWAILIIAVVIIGLDYIGVFNSNTFAPKASPGACYVLRTAAEVSLAGECNGYIPRSVAYFNGQNSWINVGNSTATSITGPLTITAWIYNPTGGKYAILSRASKSAFYEYTFDTDYNQYCVGSLPCLVLYGGQSGGNQAETSVGSYELSNWTFVAVTRQTSTSPFTENFYFDGNNPGTNNAGAGESQASIYATVIGAIAPGTGEWNFKGYMTNVQLYNTTLSASDIQTLHAEGIGGIPINLQHLAGWWPLNGDANDYSGNGDNGQLDNVTFSQDWYLATSYTPT